MHICSSCSLTRFFFLSVRRMSLLLEHQEIADTQNLARKRASEFGKTTITDGHLNGKTRQDDILVTTTASSSEISHSIPTSKFHLGGLSSVMTFESEPRGFFADQFENESNYKAHYRGTGPEILRQTGGMIDAFVSGAGTGGTISGTGSFLKKHVPEIKLVLSDPEGSGLFNKVKYNVMYDPKESEGKKRRHQVDTVVEGIGINRITHNLSLGLDMIDDAYRISDIEAVAMSRYLVEHDGLYLGSSSACNLLACVRVAKRLSSGSRIVTILCDAGHRHQNKFWSDEYLAKMGITPDPTIIDRLLDE
jgi:cysteine synthase A